MDQKKPSTPPSPASTPQSAHESPVQHLLHGTDYSDLLRQLIAEIKQAANEISAGFTDLRKTLEQLKPPLTGPIQPRTSATPHEQTAKPADISHAPDSPKF